MGSTVTTGRMAAALRASSGAIVYCLYEQTYEKNCTPHTPHWSAIYIGDAAGAVRKVFGYASMCEGGMLQNRSGRITPEGYLRTWVTQLAAPALMRPEQTVELYVKTDSYRAPLSPGMIAGVAASLAEAGLQSEANDLLAGKRVTLSLADHGELVSQIVSQHGISPWALLPDYTRPRDDAARCQSLGIHPSTAYAAKPDLPAALVISTHGDMILRDRDGTWRCQGWPYEIVGRFVKDLGQRADGFPINYCSLIRSFRDHLKAASKTDPARLLLRINRRLTTNEWERESVEKAAALPGASVDDDVITVPFSAEHDYLLAHQPRDATTWFVLNEADLFPAIAWDRRAMVISGIGARLRASAAPRPPPQGSRVPRARLRRLRPCPAGPTARPGRAVFPKQREGRTRKDRTMAELRSVDPRTLKANPDNPRKTAVPKEMDQQLVASICAIGLLQPPVVREIDGELVIRAGDRRRAAAIKADLPVIDVYVLDGDETIDAMASIAENSVRVGMNPVDTWRAIGRLEAQGWNEQAVADALALPVRAVRKLKLLGQLHPPMLDTMAKGSMPNDEQLRTIANAPLADQEQVWKKLRPKKGQDVSWWEVSRALSKPRIPFSAAKFDAALAEEYGVLWVEDLFAPAGEDSRYTTNADGFFAAQEAWMRDNLPANGTVLTIGEHGQPELPKKAERIWGKPGKHDKIGHYVNPRSGEVETVAYREPDPKKAAKAKGKTDAGDTTDAPEAPAKTRPDVTQKGQAIIGDYRTDALHAALRQAEIDDVTLVGLLVLALAGKNVTVQTGLDIRSIDRGGLVAPIVAGGVLSADHEAIRTAARAMLAYTLSCRANMSDSGLVARVAGTAIGADQHLPHMATEEFLACLSRQALERTSAAESVPAGVRVKDTRAALVKRFDGQTWHYPDAGFALTQLEINGGITPSGHYVRGISGSVAFDEHEDGGDEEADLTGPDALAEDALVEDESAEDFQVAAE